ncbi:MAG: type 2 isopentenyl-diphosphate Delta-isomerase [Methanomassiliicoccaceae archaeon]|jgi:isopentenyl-diphosphate delta-isomerase|nr:type 2 isopentenyl-diphosphate Delta-isomerase [Methanomassiliicoccaceae archaeon]
MTLMKERKADHIEICANEKVTQDHCYWDDIRLIHEALPDVNSDDIDLGATVLGKRLRFPFIVTAITGGFPGAKKINANIAEACADLGAGMGVGSQRAAVENVDKESYAVIKDFDVPLIIGNMGAPQLVPQKRKKAFTDDDIGGAMDLISADVMAIHLNFLQEVAQPEGDTNSYGCFDAIRSIARKYPIIVKETGAGISPKTAKRLSGIGVKGIDIAGMGGTSFSMVEMHRAIAKKDHIRGSIGRTFSDWGIPSPVSLMSVSKDIPVIASGGIMNGLHAASSIALGACCAGAANLILKDAMVSADAVKKRLTMIREEMKATMLLTGSADIRGLASAKYVVLGRTKEWMDQI